MNWSELGASLFSKYEKHERILVSKYLKKEDLVLELGACIGVVSLTINKILEDKSKQVSVEPNPEMFPYLLENKQRNSGEFTIETCIVSKDKEVNFHVGGAAFLSSSISGKGNKIVVKGKSLEELRKEYFDFTALIMDIEGGELNFFRSFDLKNTQIRLIVWETHCNPNMLTKEELEECYEILRTQEFKLIEKSGIVEAWIR